jgi:hypothetical protein
MNALTSGILLATLGLTLSACAPRLRPFPLRDPLWQDTDLRSVSLPCHPEPTPEDPRHLACSPEVYVSPLGWDAADNTVFRPLSHAFKVDPGGEAPNVNSLDEAPDSAWFTSRLGRRAMSAAEIARGACDPALVLDAGAAEDGAWVVDHGKMDGATPGFRVRVPGKGKYLFKVDGEDQPERPSAASVIGAAVYHAAGFNTSCEQIVYFRPSVLKLAPGLETANNSGIVKDFDQAALDGVLARAAKRGSLVRMQASAWLPGKLLGPFRYEGTRDDDPNDAIPHEDRRDLRGSRLVAAWLDHFDAREQNSMDAWIADKKGQPDASPGFVRHYYLDTSDCLGSEWAWDEVSRRLGHSYLLDFEHVGEDLVTLGLLPRPWDRAERREGEEIFGYFSTRDFDPERWQNEYPNPTFSRMTERDGAWMARILARFTPEMVRALAEAAEFSDPKHTSYLTTVLQGRLDRILARYLTLLSPIADPRIDGGDRFCGTDLARLRGVRPGGEARYEAELRVEGAEPARPLTAEEGPGAGVCVSLPHVAADGGSADDARGRYVVVRLKGGAAEGALEVHLYDLGPRRGFRIAGLVRPSP